MLGSMAETTNITGAAVPRAREARNVFEIVREARLRAEVTESDDSPELKVALKRLDRVLNAGQPLRDQVPRGFYLNIRV